MPIPQDPEAIERRRNAILEWNRRTLVGAYQTVGRRDPRWDGLAIAALDLAAKLLSEEAAPEVTEEQVHQAAEAAGCDDPMVVYFGLLTGKGARKPDEATLRRFVAAAEGITAVGYPPIRRAQAHAAAGSRVLMSRQSDGPTREAARRHLDIVMAILREPAMAEDLHEISEAAWLALFGNVATGYRLMGTHPQATVDQIDAALAAPSQAMLRLLLRGRFWYDRGWSARTTATADKVPDGGMAAFRTALEDSRTAYEAAWALRPGDPIAARQLLAIDKSIDGDRAKMELWFDRAMRADGDSHEACFTKLDWLDPKWHGTPQEMLAFGRACRATGNWRARLTLFLPEAHIRFAAMLPEAQQEAYLGSPQVWEEICSTYEDYLEHQPDRHADRSKFAMLAGAADHLDVAHAQFQALGDHLTTWPGPPTVPLEELKQMRDEIARQAANLEPKSTADPKGKRSRE